jgi:hypothetical protein
MNMARGSSFSIIPLDYNFSPVASFTNTVSIVWTGRFNPWIEVESALTLLYI